MTTADIREMITSDLPVDSPYFRPTQKKTICGREPLPLSARLAMGLNDVKFPWNVGASYAQAGGTLPHAIDGDVRDAYYFASQNYDPEFHVAQALALLDPAYRPQRHTLEALLICRDIELAGIAGWTGLPEEVVYQFQRFFFNVRDRFEDHNFIASIVFPETRFATFRSDYQDTPERNKLLQLGYRYGSAKVIFMSGLSPERLDKASMKRRTAQLQEGLLENALTLVQSGFANSDDAPGLKHAAPLLVAEPSNQDSGSFSELEKGLGGIGQGIIETLLGVQAKDIQQRIHLPEASPKKE